MHKHKLNANIRSLAPPAAAPPAAHCPLSDYVTGLPALPALVGDYGVPEEWALAMWRPVMRALEHQVCVDFGRGVC